MLLTDFLLHKTQVGELCAIRDSGWTYATAYIDHEDLFTIAERFADRTVKGDAWGTLNVTGGDGQVVSVPCHYIDV